MKKIIRAWKDPAFRETLSVAEQAELDNPAGMIELTGTDLELVGGGGSSASGKSSASGSESGKSSVSGKSSESGKSGSGSS
jgi:mersacidin/lichenicidin family type 2 lantibiotic